MTPEGGAVLEAEIRSGHALSPSTPGLRHPGIVLEWRRDVVPACGPEEGASSWSAWFARVVLVVEEDDEAVVVIRRVEAHLLAPADR